MSHRSNIAIKEEKGTIRSIYCHSGGLIESNGKKLYDHYKDKNKILELISLGDVSYIGKDISPDKDKEEKMGEHSFDNRHEGVTVAYGRDRGESGVEAESFANEEDFIKNSAFDIEKLFLFKDGEWFVCDKFGGEEAFSPLRDKIE